MKNNQNTQQSSELDDSKLVRSSRRTAPSDNLNSLLMLFKRWNWLTWVGAWVLLFGIMAISILSLVYPISLSQEPEPKTIAAENPNETSSQTSSLPLWVVGAAVTFAGSLIIFKRLNSSSHSDIRRRSSGRSLTRRQQRKLLLQGHSSSPTQPELLSPTAPMPVEIEPVVILSPEESQLVNSEEESLAQMLGDRSPSSTSDLTAGKNLTAESEPVVTVLPPEASHLVNLAEESLAEMMDIRRHRSLASILQNSKVKD